MPTHAHSGSSPSVTRAIKPTVDSDECFITVLLFLMTKSLGGGGGGGGYISVGVT